MKSLLKQIITGVYLFTSTSSNDLLLSNFALKNRSLQFTTKMAKEICYEIATSFFKNKLKIVVQFQFSIIFY